MFTGVIESKSHEGGFLVSFSGSSPALESIIINAESGIYIGKVDGVLGNTNAPLAHVAHIDRKLDLDALIGVEVGIRPKKQREERSRGSDRDGRRDDRRGNDRGFQNRDRQGGRFDRNDRGNRGDNRNGGDWDCPKCQNSNFAFRTECNRCGEPRSGGGGGRGRNDDRRGGRDDRGYQSR
ncbi:MAG: zinc finger Ran-binding domain-containing protein, partial [Candidatus Poseidoniaceae archaeon]|nr:zinc finger Ran-binding domain-containing protein [Candidatus Poseidoniaceae archaeon]